MSFFKKVMAGVGIGSARVDTRLIKDAFEVGEEVQGTVYMEGGDIEQRIDKIYLYLMTEVIKKVNDKKVRESTVLGTFELTNSIVLGVKDRKEVPFSFILPYETPITAGTTKVWLKTGLDIKMAIDPTDNDFIKVLPSPIVKTTLDALRELGFMRKKVECEYAPRLRRHFPVVQEFEFSPGAGFRGRLDELEIMFLDQGSHVDVLMEIDKKARGLFGALEEALDLDERLIRFKLTQNELRLGKQGLVRALEDLIFSNS